MAAALAEGAVGPLTGDQDNTQPNPTIMRISGLSPARDGSAGNTSS